MSEVPLYAGDVLWCRLESAQGQEACAGCLAEGECGYLGLHIRLSKPHEYRKLACRTGIDSVHREAGT